MFRKIIYTLLLVYTSVLFSQDPIHYFVGKDVFSGAQLYSVCQDVDNSMWISSDRGVYHYDGINFTKVPHKESKGDAFFGLTKDNNNNIYCYNFSGQVFKIVNKRLQLFYSLSLNKIGSHININFDNLNNLLIFSGNDLFKVNTSGKLVDVLKGRGGFTEKRNDTLYYGKAISKKEAFIVGRFNDEEFICQKLFSNLGVYLSLYTKLYFYEDKLYAFSNKKKELYLLENDSIKKIPLQLPSKNHYGSYYSNSNFWFVNSKSGVYKVNPKDLKLDIKLEKLFKNYRISDIYTDFENNTWLSTFDDGIIVIPNLNVSNFKIDNERIVTINKIDDKIYVSTNKNKIYTFKNGVFSIFFKTDFDRFESINYFKEKDIVTSSTGIYKKGKLLNSVNFNRGTVLVKDSVFVALHAGLTKVDITTSRKTQIDFRRTYDIITTVKKDKIYISSVSGLLLYDFTKVVELPYNGKNISPRKLTIVEDEIWVSSNKGIYIAKDNTITKRLTTDDGLLSNNVEKIKYEYPYVYIISSKGLQQYNTQTQKINNFIDDYGLTKSIKTFEILNNTLYAVTSNGLAVFSFNEAKSKNIKYKTHITEAITNGSKIFIDKALLEPNENNVSFSYLTTSYKYQKKLDYYYQLVGFDEKPIKAKQGQYIVNYSNLPAGKYAFKVYSSLYGQNNYPATLNFSIEEHWYKTNWFRFIAILLVNLMLYSIYRNRVKTIQRKRKEERFQKAIAESSLKSLKAQMNPHFLFNAMNSVQYLILDEKKDKAYTYLTKLSQLIRETLNMSDKTWVYLDEEIMQLTNYLELEKLRFQDDFSYIIDADESLETLKIPSMIIQPFVENSIKHGLLHKDGEKHIHVLFQMKEEVLTCIIDDNGIGREASYKINSLKPDYQKSFSTNAIRKRFELYQEYLNENTGFLYQDLLDENHIAKGTRVTITIPYKTDEE